MAFLCVSLIKECFFKKHLRVYLQRMSGCDENCRTLCIIGILLITIIGCIHISNNLFSSYRLNIPKWIDITALVGAFITLVCTFQWTRMKIPKKVGKQ